MSLDISDGKHAFFYTEWPSNFAQTKFTWTQFGETHKFFCTEQAFMWAKAKFFNDEEIAKHIIEEDSDPMTCKHLGRMVENYNDAEWDKVRYSYMLLPNLERFRQDPIMQEKLLDSRFDGLDFVEASPSDRIWGIGRAMKSDEQIACRCPELSNEKKWLGKNLLGKVITECRNRIKQEVENQTED